MRNGQVTGLAMVFRDMSRIVQAEAESSRLAAIVESSHDAIIGKPLDEQGVLIAGLALEQRAGFTARAEAWW